MPILQKLSAAKLALVVGILFALVGVFYVVVLFLPLQFSHDPRIWFTAQYYSQFIPFYTAITLLLSGMFLALHSSQANFYLAVFGHTASEEILFSWIGLTNTQLPSSAIWIFFPLSLIALWLGYFNILDQKKLSVTEAIFGFTASTAFILAPRFL